MIVRVLALLAIASSPCAAQVAELGGGVAIPVGDLNVNRKPGISGRASVWFQPAGRLFVGPAFEYARLPFDRFDDENIVSAAGFALSMFSLVGQTRLIVAGAGAPVRPTILIAAGATRHSTATGRVLLRDGQTFLLQPEGQWGFTAAGGLGLFLGVDEHVGLQTEARYIVLLLDETEPKRWQVEAALQFRVH